MSLDRNYLATAEFNNERNPIAFQVRYSMHPHGVDFNEEGNITNPTEVLLDLMATNERLNRAIAVLEDQISELRGSRALPREALIHAGLRPDSAPEVEDEYALSYSDAAVIDPTIDL